MWTTAIVVSIIVYLFNKYIYQFTDLTDSGPTRKPSSSTYSGNSQSSTTSSSDSEPKANSSYKDSSDDYFTTGYGPFGSTERRDYFGNTQKKNDFGNWENS